MGEHFYVHRYVDICKIMYKHVNNDVHLRWIYFHFGKKDRSSALVTESRDPPAAVTSGQLTREYRGRSPNPPFRRPSFGELSACFAPVLCSLFAELLLRHGESVPGDPAAAAGREESRREGGRGPQTWVGEAAWEPAAASRSKRMKWNSDVI